MIFVVLGTQKFQCNRLLKQIDSLIEQKKISENVFAQAGHSEYIPKYYEYTDFLSKEEFERKVEECSLLITHSGVGSILSGINHKKPVIVFPRLKKYKEHVDDHQLEIAQAFSQKGFVLMCGEKDDLSMLIDKSRIFKFGFYESRCEKIIETIRRYIQEEIKEV